jgi:hypothetical protein
VKNVQGQPGNNDSHNFLVALRRAMSAETIKPFRTHRVGFVSFLVLALGVSSLLVAALPVSATAAGTTSLTDNTYTAIAAMSQATSSPQSNLSSSSMATMMRELETMQRSHKVVSHLESNGAPSSTTQVATPPPTTTTSTTPTAPAPTSTTSTPPPVTTTTTVPPAPQRLSDPSANIVPSPDFMQSGQCTSSNGSWTCANPCVTSSLSWPAFSNDPACTNYILQAINVARGDEGLVAMVLPSNWYSISQDQQLFVIANLERTARGFPPYLGLNAALSANAQHAAATNSDPSLATGFSVGNDAQGEPGMGGAWAGGFTVLAADYVWMYDDGWGGNAAATSNIVCTSPSASGCWAHRDELLGSDLGYNPGVGLNCQDCEMGAGYAEVGNTSSFADLIELPKGDPPAMTFTWAQELAQGF